MKIKLAAVFMAAIAIFSTVCLTVGAESAENERNVIDGIVAFFEEQGGVSSVEELIVKTLADGAGTRSEWQIIALAQSGDYDFSAYIDALERYISEGRVLGAVTRQKLALAEMACGVYSDFTVDVVENTIGEGGIMSLVFGLHLINNGFASGGNTTEGVVEKLLSLRLSDGGWAISGNVSDVDVTAMALCALAPNMDVDGVAEAAEGALALLSARQTENGGFVGFSGENAESAAQVLLALSSFGIDYRSDERFIKNGATVFDALMKYALDDGSFSHEKDGEYNLGATEQVWYCLVGVVRMQEGKSPLLVLDGAKNLKYIANAQSGDATPTTKTADYKPIATAVLAVVFVGVCVALLITKKRNAKNFIAAFVIFAGAVTFVWLTNFSSPSDYYGADIKKENPIGTVTITIRCDTVVGKASDGYIPPDGVLLDTESYEIEAGETAYDILIQAARKHRISIDEKSYGYISGIGYIYEFRFGELSGWMFFVNGEEASVSANRYVLSDGDVIEWLYSCDMGKDLRVKE